MKMETKSDTVYFSVKGQVVIPRWLRREFDIEEGTRAYVQSTPQGILIKPVTRTYIKNIQSKSARAKLVKAADAVTNGGLTVPKAAEQHGVPIHKLKGMLGEKSPDSKGVPMIKRRISFQFKSLSSKNGAIMKDLQNKLEDGDVTEAQVFSVIKHIEHHQSQGVNTISNWRQRFEAKAKEAK
jgi:bifunctional DNA-binding transcriptional regulator/antitoxin component of YhaV-PrlF toxin-antitoxin module